MPIRIKVWLLRILAVASIFILCRLADSGDPAYAFAWAWGPNGFFLAANTRGVLRLPSVLESVHPKEPLLYRWIGVGVVKRIVATREWVMLGGLEPPVRPTNRSDFLKRLDLEMKGAEICHGATFVLVSCVALIYLALGSTSAAGWMIAFNVLLNAYPVMLQRSNRWRLQRAYRMA